MTNREIAMVYGAKKSGSPSVPGDLYAKGNAASVGSEANSIVPWFWNFGNVEITSSTEEVKDGQYALKIRATQDGGSNCRAEYDFNLEDGEDYQIKIWAKRGQGVNQTFNAWTGFTNWSNTSIAAGDWQEYTFNLTTSGTTQKIRAYAQATGSINDVVYIDQITIVKTSVQLLVNPDFDAGSLKWQDELAGGMSANELEFDNGDMIVDLSRKVTFARQNYIGEDLAGETVELKVKVQDYNSGKFRVNLINGDRTGWIDSAGVHTFQLNVRNQGLSSIEVFSGNNGFDGEIEYIKMKKL